MITNEITFLTGCMQKDVKEMYQSRVYKKLESIKNYTANPFTTERCIINITVKISLTRCRKVKNVLHFAGKNNLFSVAINNSL